MVCRVSVTNQKDTSINMQKNNDYHLSQFDIFDAILHNKTSFLFTPRYPYHHRNSDSHAISTEYSFLTRGRGRAQRCCHLTAPISYAEQNLIDLFKQRGPVGRVILPGELRSTTSRLPAASAAPVSRSVEMALFQ